MIGRCVVLFACVAVAAAMTWTNCGQPDDLCYAQTVTMSPDPAPRGAFLDVVIVPSHRYTHDICGPRGGSAVEK